MKKLFTLLLVVLLVVSVTPTAFAETLTPNNTTILTTTVPDAEYTLNIPIDQKIPYGETTYDIGEITVTNASGFATGKNLSVTIEYTSFSAENVSTTIPFSIMMYNRELYEKDGSRTIAKQSVESGSTITFKGQSDGSINQYAGVRYQPTNDSRNLDMTCIIIDKTDWGKALAGEYSATITFTAEVVAE